MRNRPAWHRPAGLGAAALGVLIVVVNYAEHFDVGLMPGGHKEIYFVVGLAVVGAGAWLLAVFDRPV